METISKSIALCLKKVCGSGNSAKAYRAKWLRFFQCIGTQPDKLVEQWKQVKYDLRLREQFIGDWTEKIEEYIYNNFQDYTSGSRMTELAAI